MFADRQSTRRQTCYYWVTSRVRSRCDANGINVCWRGRWATSPPSTSVVAHVLSSGWADISTRQPDIRTDTDSAYITHKHQCYGRHVSSPRERDTWKMSESQRKHVCDDYIFCDEIQLCVRRWKRRTTKCRTKNALAQNAGGKCWTGNVGLENARPWVC